MKQCTIAILIFVLCSLLALRCVEAQTIFYSEDFNSGGGTWTLNTNGPGSNDLNANVWKINTDGTCGCQTGGNNKLHVGCDPADIWCGLLYGPGCFYNAGGITAISTDKFAQSGDISTIGRTNITLSFYYQSVGEVGADYGLVRLSDDGGSTWTDLGTQYSGTSACTQETITIPAAYEGISNFRIAFRWINNDNSMGADPPFSIDDIELTIPAISSPPVANFGTASTMLCETTCITFTDSSTNTPTFWAWSFPGATPDTSNDQNPAGICYDTAGVYSVTLSATNSAGTHDTTFIAYIDVDTAATVSANVDDVICGGIPYTLSGSMGGSASSVTWTTSGDGTFNDSSLLGAVYTPGSGDIGTVVTLTITTDDPAGPCGAASHLIGLDVNPLTTASAGPDTTICSTASYTITGSSIGGNAGSQVWTTSGTGTFNDSTLLSPIYTPSPADTAAGCVTLTITTDDPAGPCLSTSDDMDLCFAACVLPIPNFSASDTIICETSCINFMDSTLNSPTAWAWSFPGGIPDTSNNQNPTNICYDTAGTYSVSLSATNSNGTTVVTMSGLIIISATPTVNAGVDDTICDNASYTLSGAVGNGAISAVWTTSGDGFFDDSSSAGAIYAPGSADILTGSVDLVLTTDDPAGPCIFAIDSMTLTIVSSPVLDSIVTSDASGCGIADGIAVLFGTGGTTPLQYSINGGGTYVGTTTFISLTTGSYDAVIMDDLGCISNNLGFIISAPGTPGAPTASADFTYCDGDSIMNLTASGSNIEWFSDGGLTTSLGTGSPLVIAPGVGVTSYFVTQTVSGCQSSADTVVIMVNAAPAAPTLSADTTYCDGDTIADLTASGTNILWYSDAALTNSIGTGSPLAINPGVGITIYYAIQTSAGCQSATSQVTITVNTCGALVASYTADLTSGCAPLCVNFTNTSTDTISTTIWQFPGSDLGSFLGASPPPICYIAPGSYDVTLIIIDGTDSDTSEMLGYINIYGPPNILISGNTTMAAGDSTVLSASGGASYVWSPDSTLSSGTGSTVTASPSATTTYIVVGTDSNGCMDTTSLTVLIEPTVITTDTAVFVPNIFKPGNGNPDNEKLYVFGNGIESYTLMIFERWGPKVYETSDATQTDLDNGICCKYGLGWDGNYQSGDKKLNTAVFDYVLVGTYLTGDSFTRKGSITLLK